MPNYSLVSTSKFQPFSFERYMQPLQIYSQLYDARYKELQEQALISGLMGSLVDPELDTEVYEGLQRYNNRLNKLADVMSNIGLTPNSRKDFLGLWHQYATDVAPIEKWAQLRNEAIKAQDAIRLQTNGNVAFTKDARKTSLDYYRKGRPLEYETMNMNAAMAETTAMIQAISKRNIESGLNPLGDYMETYKRQGYVDLQELMSKSEDARKAIESILNKYGFDNPNFSDEDKRRLVSAVQEGATGGLYYDEAKTYNPSWRAQNQASLQNSMTLARYNKELDEAYGNKYVGNDADGNPVYVDKDGDSFSVLPNGTKVYDPNTMHSLGYKLDNSDGGSGSTKSGSSKSGGSEERLYLPENSRTLLLPHVEGGPKAASSSVEALRKLGIDQNTNKNGQVVKRKIKIYRSQNRTGSYGTESYRLTQDKGDVYMGEFSVFDKNGLLMSRDAFVNNIMKAYENKYKKVSQKTNGRAFNTVDMIAMRRSLGEYYDNNIKPSVDIINKQNNTNFKSIHGLHAQATKTIKYGNDREVRGIPIRFDESEQQRILDDLIAYSPDKKIIRLTGSVYDYREKNKKDNSDKFFGNLATPRGDGKPSVQMFIINSKDPRTGRTAKGILIQSGDRKWFVPEEYLGSNGRSGFNYWNSKEMSNYRQLKEDYDRRGETRASEIVQQNIDDLGSAGLRLILQDLGLTYDVPDAKTYKQEQ